MSRHRYLIFIPIIIIGIGLLVRFDEKNTSIVKSESITIIPTVSISPSISSQSNSSVSTLFNLEGPLVCQGNMDKGSYQAFILNNKIHATLTSTAGTTELRLINDCLYEWKDMTRTGTKICGISQYLNLLKSFPFLGQMAGSKLGAGIDFTKMFATCQKKDVGAVSFIVPQTVQFTESTLSQ